MAQDDPTFVDAVRSADRFIHSFTLLAAEGARPPEGVRRWSQLDAGEWAGAIASSTERRNSGPAPRGMPAAFMLQYSVGILATTGVTLAVTGPFAPDLDGNSLFFSISSVGHFPERVWLSKGSAHAHSSVDVRVDRTRAQFVATATDFVDRVDVGVKMSSRQRRGMVHDCWAMAVRDLESVLTGRPARVVARRSCCFVYALPGCRECAGCPRSAAASS